MKRYFQRLNQFERERKAAFWLALMACGAYILFVVNVIDWLNR